MEEEITLFDVKDMTKNLTFHDNNDKEIGRLDWENGKFVFTGDAEESAKVFFDWLNKMWRMK